MTPVPLPCRLLFVLVSVMQADTQPLHPLWFTVPPPPPVFTTPPPPAPHFYVSEFLPPQTDICTNTPQYYPRRQLHPPSRLPKRPRRKKTNSAVPPPGVIAADASDEGGVRGLGEDLEVSCTDGLVAFGVYGFCLSSGIERANGLTYEDTPAGTRQGPWKRGGARGLRETR